MERNEKRILIAAVVLLLIFFGGLGYAYRSYGVRIPNCVTDVRPFTEGAIIQRGENDFEVQMVAKMWTFEPKEVTLPPGSKVTLYLSSADVVHGMQVLGTNVNLMAIPGTVNLAEVTFDEEGEYPMICHEYCGRNHQNMAGKFIIREGATLEPPASPDEQLAEMEALFDEYACTLCHTLDGSDEEMAPGLNELFGKPRTLADGTTLVADEAYIREAILDPEKHVVEGYDAMPETEEIPPEQFEAMMEALRKLSE